MDYRQMISNAMLRGGQPMAGLGGGALAGVGAPGVGGIADMIKSKLAGISGLGAAGGVSSMAKNVLGGGVSSYPEAMPQMTRGVDMSVFDRPPAAPSGDATVPQPQGYSSADFPARSMAMPSGPMNMGLRQPQHRQHWSAGWNTSPEGMGDSGRPLMNVGF
jgi:hypothetical protein